MEAGAGGGDGGVGLRTAEGPAVAGAAVANTAGRALGTTTFAGDRGNAAFSSGNPSSQCTVSGQPVDYCINGCRSRFYRVAGSNGAQIKATTCPSANTEHQIYVWKGAMGASCTSFQCVGTVTLRMCQAADRGEAALAVGEIGDFLSRRCCFGILC
jgi:hypothetical protein